MLRGHLTDNQFLFSHIVFVLKLVNGVVVVSGTGVTQHYGDIPLT